MVAPQTEIAAMLNGAEIFRAVLIPGDYIIGQDENVDIRLNTSGVLELKASVSGQSRSLLKPE